MATRIPNIWVAGEAACVSLHGANRLGSNSTAECLVWGGICGEEMVKALPRLRVASISEARVQQGRRHVEEIANRTGNENLYQIKQELRAMMDRCVGVYRKGAELNEAVKRIAEIRERSKRAPVSDKGKVYNSNLFHALELENLIDLAEVTVAGALERKESRGAHARRDFSTRNDQEWLKHTLAFHTEGAPRLTYKPVSINTWKPVERKY